MDPGGGVRWKLFAETFRIWLPVVISVCAISLTIFQAMATRRHTRLSVQPRVDWRIEQISEAGSVIVSLANLGFGPAIISDVTLMFDGEPLGPADPATCDEMDRRLGRDGDAWDTACFTITGEYVLRPGDSVVIYGSRPDETLAGQDHTKDEIDFRRVSADARYCSFYEDCWQVGERQGG